MNKNAMVQEGRTLCEYCGGTSVTIMSGIAVCSQHIDRVVKQASLRAARPSTSRGPSCASLEISDALDELTGSSGK